MAARPLFRVVFLRFSFWRSLAFAAAGGIGFWRCSGVWVWLLTLQRRLFRLLTLRQWALQLFAFAAAGASAAAISAADIFSATAGNCSNFRACCRFRSHRFRRGRPSANKKAARRERCFRPRRAALLCCFMQKNPSETCTARMRAFHTLCPLRSACSQ